MADIVRRDPFAVGDMRDWMERFFGEPLVPSLFSRWEESALPVDISEKDGEVVVRASLPGFSKDDIDVQIDNGMLSITAKKDEEREEKGERYYRRERYAGSVSRRIALPGQVDEGNVNAELRDGVLTIRVPSQEAQRARHIEIKSSEA